MNQEIIEDDRESIYNNIDRKKAKEKKCNAIVKGIKCNNKAIVGLGEKYCFIHRSHWLKMRDMELGIIRCSQGRYCSINGIKQALTNEDINNKFKTCALCRNKDSDYSKKIRKTKDELRKELLKKNKSVCDKCSINKIYELKEMHRYEDGSYSNYCKDHHEKRKIEDIKRSKTEHRIKYNKEYEKSEGRKTSKKLWRANNPDKVYIYYTSYRARKLNEDPIEYRKKQAANARRYREKLTEEKITEIYEKKKNNPVIIYSYYEYRADMNKLDFEIEFEDFVDILSANCHYCDAETNYTRDFMGIDRIDNEYGYIYGNIVPCCTMCNMMKYTETYEKFILKCDHIRYYIYENISKHQKVFKDKPSIKLIQKYKHCAEKRNVSFSLDKSTFNCLVNGECHYCGKCTEKNIHYNGIDRLSSNKGYTKNNCVTCCGDCNLMKNVYNYSEFIKKCRKISKRFENDIPSLKKLFKKSEMNNSTDKRKTPSKDEIKEIRKERNDERHRKTMESKTKENIEKRAAEIKERIKNKYAINIDDDE